MKILVPVILLFMTFAFWLAIERKDNGRLPADEEEVLRAQETNKVTGELLNVEIVRCRVCGQVLSYVKFNLKGRVVQGHKYMHRCGKYGPVTRYNGSELWPPGNEIIPWLEKWQRRLRVKR